MAFQFRYFLHSRKFHFIIDSREAAKYYDFHPPITFDFALLLPEPAHFGDGGGTGLGKAGR